MSGKRILDLHKNDRTLDDDVIGTNQSPCKTSQFLLKLMPAVCI